MKQLRTRAIILGIWFVFVFNIERILRAVANGGLFSDEINLFQSYTYIFVALIFLVILALPKMKAPIFIVLMSSSVSLFMVLWYNLVQWDNYVVTDGNQVATLTTLAIVQVSAIVLTGLLTRQVNASIHEFEDVIASITYNHIGARPKPFFDTQGEMYRELKRARYYQRPLSVVAIEMDQADITANIPAVVDDVQQALMKEFVLAKIARLLDLKLDEFNSIALKDNNFVIVLPETDVETLPETISRLKRTLLEEMNISPSIGTATFPEGAVTFERLVEMAIADIQLDDSPLKTDTTKIPLPEKQISTTNEGQPPLITENV